MRTATTFAAFALAAPIMAHHSDAGLDMSTVVTLEGTVKEFFWRNPHVYFTVETLDETGEPVEWSLQMGSTISVGRMGWTRETLSPGDRVTVDTHPAIDGRPYGIVEHVEKAGGVIQAEAFYQPEVNASTDTLEGTWMAKSSELVRYPGGFDGFFLANLRLTEAGRMAMEAYDPFSSENPEATCVGRPTPAMLVSSDLYPIEIQFRDEQDIVIIRTDFWDEERIVYMDAREHPDPGERFQTGHSIGWWEGDTLVVDTRNFSDHRSPYQIGVPSGGQKHVVERYRLIEGGTRIALEFVLEDPEYIAEPLTHARELVYSPHLVSTPFNCDPEQTRRFLPQQQ